MGSNPRLAPWAALLRRCAAQDDIGVRTGGSKIRPYVVRCGCMGAGFFAAVFLARLIILEMHRSLGASLAERATAPQDDIGVGAAAAVPALRMTSGGGGRIEDPPLRGSVQAASVLMRRVVNSAEVSIKHLT